MRPQRARTEPEGLEDHRRCATDLLGQRVEEVLDADRRRLDGFLLRPVQEREHGAREIGQAVRALGQSAELRLDLGRHLRRFRAGLLEDRGDAGISLDGPRQEVDGLDLGVLALVGQSLCRGHDGLGVGSVSSEVNRLFRGHRAESSAKRPRRADARVRVRDRVAP